MQQPNIETDGNRVPLVKTSTEEIIEDLQKLEHDDLLAVAASMGVTLFEFNWKEQFVKFQKGLKND